jgi:hypothetical protein
MKLQDLESSSVQKSQKVFESYFEKKMDLSAIGQVQALEMLKKVRSTINEYRNSTSFHTSESNPKYLRAIFMEQALQSIVEMDAPMAIDMNDPKTKSTLDKASKGQNLTPDEQKTVTAVALLKKEGKKKKGYKVMESEIQQAQVVLAAQDMVDRVQDMIEDITDMEYKDLPALVESIKNEVGTSQAQQFRDQATTALEGLVGNLQNAKGQLESAQGVLTGQEPVVPGEGEMDMDMNVDTDAGDVEVDVDVDAEEPESDLEASLGRARR